ncbi:hypothetical protein GCM10010319_67080 [Streptomyces blastmyceticus]|uniref:Uncharacterized protein n=1 Tax=Streptomyces blastmyceticus TaxID=68180 RepID=A0ABN0Y136_9ACTN
MSPSSPDRAQGEDDGASCGVYMWATAHGIDLKPSSPLRSCTCFAHTRTPREAPEVGAFVIDTRTDRVGQVMGHEGSRLQLRPPHGGREWEAEPDAARARHRFRAAQRQGEGGQCGEPVGEVSARTGRRVTLVR